MNPFINLSIQQNPPSIPITRNGESFGAAMAEYVIGQIIAQERHFRRMDECQRGKTWTRYT